MNFVGTLETFAERFMKDQISQGPYFQHIEEAWKLRDHPNVLFVFYEEMKANLKLVIKRVSNFLNCPMDDINTDLLIEHLDIKNFRNNSSVNLEFLKEGDARMFEHGNFIRTGLTGGGKQELDQFPAVKNKFDDWENKNLKNTGIVFPQMK